MPQIPSIGKLHILIMLASYSQLEASLYFYDHARFRKPSRVVPMGMMYFKSHACTYISNCASPFWIPWIRPLVLPRSQDILDRRKRCEKFTDTKQILPMEQCIICKKKVEDEEQGLECYLCDQWKHIGCVWSVDRPSESMYEALTEIRRLFCMCALTVVSNFLCLSTIVNLKWNMNAHAKSGWPVH